MREQNWTPGFVMRIDAIAWEPLPGPGSAATLLPHPPGLPYSLILLHQKVTHVYPQAWVPPRLLAAGPTAPPTSRALA